MFIVVGISTTLDCFSLFAIAKLSLWKQRKFLQLFLLNVTNILSAISHCLFIGIQSLERVERLECVLSFHLFIFGMGVSWMGVLGLGVDCLVAVFFPLKFRAIMTTKQFFKFNGIFFILIFVTIICPIPLLAFQNEGILTFLCDYVQIAPKFYLLYLFCSSALFLLSLLLLNISIAIGVILALIKQQKLKAEGNKSAIANKMLKLVFRLLLIILVSIICNLPLNSQVVGISITRTDRDAILLAFTSGLWNILIFVIADQDFRTSALSAFKCRHKEN